MFKIPTIKLPYDLPVNCILYFDDTVNKKIECCLHDTKDKRTTPDIPGINETKQTIRIRTVNPKLLPDYVKISSRAKAEIIDNSTGFVTKYILTVDKINQSQWKESTEMTGAFLECSIIQSMQNSTVDNSNPFGE